MNKKRIIFVMVAVVMAVFLTFSLFLDKESTVNIYASNATLGEYLIQGVDSNFQFKVYVENSQNNIEVYDVNGKVVETRISKGRDIITVKAPKKGYTKGERYHVTLPEGAYFEQEELRDARSIIFIVKKKEVAIEVFQEGVKDIRQSNVVIQSENTAVLPLDKQVQIGDVLIVTDSNTRQNRALKVTSLSTGTDGQVVQFESPEKEEVYQDLDIYKTYTLDADDIIIYDDEIVRWIEDEGIIEKFFPSVEASSDREIKIEAKSEKDRVKILVKIFPSKADLRVGIEIEFEIISHATMQIDGIMKSNMFIDTTVISTIRLITENKQSLIPPGLINVDKANELLESKGAVTRIETPKGKIIGVRVPLTATVSLFLDFDIPVSYEISGGGSLALQGRLDMGVGVLCNQKCEAYSTFDGKRPPIPVELVGKLGVKAGLGLSAGVEFFWSIKMGAEAVVGYYAEIEGLLRSPDIMADPIDILGYFEFEFGYFTENNIFIYRDGKLLKFQYEFKMKETKTPFVTISNANIFQTILIDPVSINDGKFKIDKLEAQYYNVISRKSEKVPINQEYMKIMFNDTQVEKEGEFYLANGMAPGQNKVVLHWVHNGTRFSHDMEIELKERLGRETLIQGLIADEIVHIKDNYWSYKVNNKYGIVTTQGKIIPAQYDEHFYEGMSGQMCSYRNNDFVGFEEDLNREIYCDGHGYYSSDYYYDISKRWMYEYDYSGMLTRANFWYIGNQQTEVVQRVIAGTGSTEDYAFNYNLLDEYALMRITNTGGDYRITELTKFDYTQMIKVVFEGDWYYVVRAKNGKWGLIDNNGRTIIAPMYDRFIIDLNGPLLPQPSHFTVFSNNKYYVIDKNNTVLFESTNDETFTGTFNNNLWIKRSGKWYVVDLRSN